MFTEKDFDGKINMQLACIEANRLICGDLKLQTMHNHACKAMKDGNLNLYLQKVISKGIYNFHKSQEDKK